MKPSSRSLLPRVARALAVTAFAAAAVALAGCSISRPSPAKRTYLLEPELPVAVASPRPVALRVGMINVGAPYRGKAFVYRLDELKFEADFYSEFFVAPAALLSESTAKALTSAGVFQRVIPPGSADDGDFVLDGFATDLYGDDRDPAKPVAVLAITFYLSPANALVPRVIWSREYRQRVPLAEPTADALARSWNSALATILADLSRDLAAAELPKP